MPKTTQELKSGWKTDPVNGFIQPTASVDSSKIKYEIDSIWIDSDLTSNEWIEFTADPNEGLEAFDLTSVTLGKYSDPAISFEFTIVGTKESNGTTVLKNFSWSAGSELTRQFSGTDFSEFTGINKFRITLRNVSTNIYNIEFKEFTIDNQVSSGNSSPVMSGLDNVDYLENDVNQDFLQIDPEVTVTDNESADFDGGQITVSYSGTPLLEDQLSVCNTGNITLSGNTVNYDGIGQIGTASGGIDGASLSILLNSNATPGRTSELLEAIAYKNTSDEPTSYRTISITVSHGDGGTSLPVTAVISVSGQGESGVEYPANTQDLNNNWLDDLNNGFTIQGNGGVTLGGDDTSIWINSGTGTASFSIAAGEQFDGGMFDLSGLTFDVLGSGHEYTVTIVGYKSDGSTATANVTGDTKEGLAGIDLSSITEIVSFDFQVTGLSSAVDSVGLDSFTIANPGTTNTPPCILYLPYDISVNENQPSNVDLSAASFYDTDAGANPVTLTLTVSVGTLSASSGDGVTVTGSGTDSIILSGAVTYIDTYLNTASNIKYTGPVGVSGDDAATLTLTANDGGGTDFSLGTVYIDITELPPTVSSVSSEKDDGVYGIGEVIDITVAFTKPVTVTGTPQLTLETGTIDRIANYTGGSGLKDLTFTYTVQVGGGSVDLDYASTNALSLNNGTIQTASGTDAVLTLPAPGSSGSLGYNKAIVIDATAPTASVSMGSTNLTDGETTIVTFSFTEAVIDFTNADLSVSNGVLTPVSSADGGSTYTATFTADSVNDDTNTITIDLTGITDLAGNPGSGTAQSDNYTVSVSAPIAVTLQSAAADGAEDTDTSTRIDLSFDTAIVGLTAEDITITGGTGAAVKGALTGSGTSWSITLTSVTEQGNVSVAVSAPAGYSISGSPKAVAVYKEITITNAVISPATGSFDKNTANQSDVQTTITSWGSATGVTDVKAGGISIGTENYGISGNTLTIKKEYLAEKAVGSLELTVEFSTGSAATLTIDITDTTPPTISPTSGFYDLNDCADVTAMVLWNSAATVTEVVYGLTPLMDTMDYTVAGNTLTILESYLSGLTLTEGDILDFDITFNTGADATFTVYVVDNYVPSNNADLSSLSVNGVPLSDFDPHLTAYDVELPYGTSSAAIIAATSDPNAGCVITQASSLPGSATVEVTAEDRTTTRTYTINFTIAENHTPDTTYTVTFISNGSIYIAKTVNLGDSIGSTAWPSNPVKNGYIFGGWYTGENGSGNEFTSATTVSSDITVYAKWTYSRDEDDDGSDPLKISTPATPTFNAKVKAGNGYEMILPITTNKNRRSSVVDIGFEQPISGGTVITIPSIPDVETYSMAIPVTSISTTDIQGTLKLNTEVGSITVTSNMLTGVTGIRRSRAQISIGQGDKLNLPEDLKAIIGNKPLIQLTLTIDGKQTEWNNSNAPVTVSIPYTPAATELANPESIVIWYIDGRGKAVNVTNGRYDAVTGTVTFTTTHFSYYAVAYNQVSFKDVAKDVWYAKAVSYIAARDIDTGMGNGYFSPENKLTRGRFIVMLMKAYGIAPETNTTDNFTDAGSTDYAGYLAAAKHLDISKGIGNNMFDPDKEITRQEMFTLLYNGLKKTGKLPRGNSGKALPGFSDAGDIASWAEEAMEALVKSGVIEGDNGMLNPTVTATKAEMAQMLYNLLSK